MMDRFEQLDPIEASLKELIDAERAGLFRRTLVDVRSLLCSAPTADRELRFMRKTRWISIAAVVAFAATICGWFYTTGTLNLSEDRIPGGTILVSAPNGCDGKFFTCLTGPNGTPTNACGAFDYDADGDIDLVDARTYQLSCNGISR